ncbi:hypothetical protein CPB83DRAFT_412532 [Crepidotus variabilis]|uniref:F-box domain-containing protein n=1 Tax=Crepidotus variabilis TaxID=179855 RepID=A0A9P6ERF4_9AGAR|nr:hypothetical protein CPB83DRAFT_412532 [Crepidotus variabilis]
MSIGLHDDIWSTIFYKMACENAQLLSLIRSPCTHWRDLADSTALLWTNITLDHPSYSTKVEYIERYLSK